MLRSIRRRPFQSALFVVGVALGVSLIVAIDLANGSAARAFTLFTESIAGRATHQILGGPGGVPDSVYARLRTELGIRQAAPVLTAYTQAVELNNQPLPVFGIDPFAEAPFRGYLDLGTNANADTSVMAAFMTQPDTGFISDQLAAQNHLKVGDSLTLRYGPKEYKVTILGLLHGKDDVTTEGLQDLFITDVSTAQELLGMQGRLTNIDLIVPNGPPGDALLAKINTILPPGVSVQAAGARSTAISGMTDAFNLSLNALSLLALVVGMFLIYNTVTFSVVQRRAVLGTLRALGVTRGQIFIMIIGEPMLLSMMDDGIGLGDAEI